MRPFFSEFCLYSAVMQQPSKTIFSYDIFLSMILVVTKFIIIFILSILFLFCPNLTVRLRNLSKKDIP